MGIIWLQISCLIFIVTLLISIFVKKSINTVDLFLFKIMILANVVGLVIELLCFFTVANRELYPILNFLATNLLLIYYLFFISLFTYYVLNFLPKKRNLKFWFKLLTTFFIINSIIIFLLPMKYYSDGVSVYSYGSAVNYLIFLFGIFALIWLLLLISYYKKLSLKRKIPLIAFILFSMIGGIVQKFHPEILITTPIESIIVFLLYLTIENPDVKMINELHVNKDILEKNNEDRSNFMFRMTQEVRKPISNIDSLTNMIDIKNKYVTLEDIVNAIKSNTRHISYVVNNVLDVSNIDIRKIKLVNTTYNIQRLFEEINILMQEKISPDITYRANISNEVPELLYGDYIKLKQIIMSILMNSIENTKKGFIELNINVLIKYDMCRLIISVEDSGKGMDIKQVNDILTIDKPIEEEDNSKLDSLDVDLNIAKKIINLVGGSMTIKSEVNKGTEFIVVIDQKIADNKNQDKQYKSLNKVIKKVLLVDDDINKLQLEKNLLEKNQIDVISTMYGLDVIDKIRTGENFDLILLDDDMTKLSGVATYQELNKLDNFNIPIVIMLEKNKEIIKNHYLDKGFIDYLLKDNLEEEINRIVNKYLK